MLGLESYFTAFLDEIAKRLSARRDRQRQVKLLAERVSNARRLYRRLDRDRREELRRAAHRLAGLRERLAALTGAPGCCTDCARRMAQAAHQPSPAWPGGFCCGGDPIRIFDELEIAALWLDGRAPLSSRMVPRPRGCFYRGSHGCVLRSVDRPSICGRYLCSDLTQALARTGALPEILEYSDKLEVEMARIADLLGLPLPFSC